MRLKMRSKMESTDGRYVRLNLRSKFILIFCGWPLLLFLSQCTQAPSRPNSVSNSTPGLSSSTTSGAAVATAPKAEPLTFNGDFKNRAGADKLPYVVLVSIDGYRYDYNSLFHPPHLERIEKEGVSAESLIPIYPSKTFPNHYSIVTGLYPDRTGIVSNEFYDPARKQVYAIGNRQTVEDGTWYSGEPIWLKAEKHGLVTASCFWVGSEAGIQGGHPNSYFRYNALMPYEWRVQTVLDWLNRPSPTRPHFITLYFDQVDAQAHKFGVGSPEVKKAVADVDKAIAQLEDGIRDSKLPVNLIIVSDHGMQDLVPAKQILIDDNPEVAKLLSAFMALGKGPQLSLYLKEGRDQSLIAELQKLLQGSNQHFRTMRRNEMATLHGSLSDRTGDLVLIPEAPFVIGLKSDPPSTTGANHGWDVTEAKEMNGVFLAEGPSLRPHTRLKSFENIHVYSLINSILQLDGKNQSDSSEIDARLKFTSAALKASVKKH